jgi:uncharacterized protein YcnI
MVVLRAVAAVAALAAAGAAEAHVSVSPDTGVGGAYTPLRFQVGHGCDGKATTALRLEMPPGLTVARPQPKPGWRLQIERAGDAVTAITWRGRLPADQFDEFLVLVRLPDRPGLVHFPAAQSCGGDTVRWDQPASPDAPPSKRPAPRIYITPTGPSGPVAAPPGVAAPHHHQD